MDAKWRTREVPNLARFGEPRIGVAIWRRDGHEHNKRVYLESADGQFRALNTDGMFSPLHRYNDEKEGR